MRFSWVALIFWVLMAPASGAEDGSELKSLQTGDDSRGWEAVGRLNFAGQAFCTGALITPDLVLTAAHCLFDKDSGRLYDISEIEFLAGWRNGRATARSGVRRAIPHPKFQFQSEGSAIRVANDLALLRLVQPIRKSSVKPFDTEIRPRKGDEVGVVSYGRERSQSPALQEVCQVLARRSGTLVLSCDVDYGSSGAPVFSIDADGEARIVSVISAKAEIRGRQVSLGTSLARPLADLMALMANNEVLPVQESTGVRMINLGATGSSGGAKFVRP